MVWARSWLEYVQLAYRTLKRQELALASRREAALALPSALSMSATHGGASDPMAKVDAVIDAERDMERLDWAWEAIAEFDSVMAQLRDGCEREVLNATWMAEEHFRFDKPCRVAARNCGVSVSTLLRHIRLLCDYLDYVGKDAFGL